MAQDQEHTVASFIHEMLHTLGLGENPPSSTEITRRVQAACRSQASSVGSTPVTSVFMTVSLRVGDLLMRDAHGPPSHKHVDLESGRH